MERKEKIELYQKVYTYVLAGWLSNRYSANGTAESTANAADKLAHLIASKYVSRHENFMVTGDFTDMSNEGRKGNTI